MNIGEGLIFTRGLSNSQRQKLSARNRRGELIKLSSGVYYPKKQFYGLKPGEKSFVASVAIGAGRHTLVGKSAAAALLFPYLDQWIKFVPEAHGRSNRSHSSLRFRSVPDVDVHTVEIYGHLIKVSSAAETVVDISRWYDVPSAVALGDKLVRDFKLDPGDLQEAIQNRRYCDNVESAEVAAQLIDGRSESVREAEVKVGLHTAGITGFLQQVDVFSAAGEWIGRADFLDPESSVALEYDGRGKLEGQFGVEPAKAAGDERKRERKFTTEAVRVVRIDSKSFTSGDWLLSVERALEENRGRVLPKDQWKPHKF